MTLADICRERPGKRKCRNGDCPSMTYASHRGRFCVICDHEQYERCTGCGSLAGWCRCAQPAREEAAREFAQAKEAVP